MRHDCWWLVVSLVMLTTATVEEKKDGPAAFIYIAGGVVIPCEVRVRRARGVRMSTINWGMEIPKKLDVLRNVLTLYRVNSS